MVERPRFDDHELRARLARGHHLGATRLGGLAIPRAPSDEPAHRPRRDPRCPRRWPRGRSSARRVRRCGLLRGALRPARARRTPSDQARRPPAAWLGEAPHPHRGLPARLRRTRSAAGLSRAAPLRRMLSPAMQAYWLATADQAAGRQVEARLAFERLRGSCEPVLRAAVGRRLAVPLAPVSAYDLETRAVLDRVAREVR